MRALSGITNKDDQMKPAMRITKTVTAINIQVKKKWNRHQRAKPPKGNQTTKAPNHQGTQANAKQGERAAVQMGIE
jgi:hypothetical protein